MIEELIILTNIIFITIILTADNAVIVGSIASNFVPKNRKQIILWGVIGAFVFKIFFAIFATFLFEFYFIKILGGLLLIWIVNDLRKDLLDIKKVKPTTKKGKEPSYISSIGKVLFADIMISANKTFPMLLMYEGSLPFLVVGFTFLISSKSFLKSFTIQINNKPPKIFIK